MTQNLKDPPILSCACASLRRAARAVTQLYDDALRDGDLRSTQFTLLQVLDRKGEMTQGELGEILALDSTTLTRSLSPLSKLGVLRSRRGQDKRERIWMITPAGKRRLTSLTSKWGEVQARLREQLGNDQWDRLLGDLATVSGAAVRAAKA